MKLINPKYRKTHITDKKIQELQQKMEWEGTGTTEGPIVINNLNGLRPNIWIHRSTSHILIQNVTIYNLICTNSQNITIENCKIAELEIEGCFNIHARNNAINGLKILYTKGSIIEDNYIFEDSLERLRNDYYTRIMPSIHSVLWCVIAIMLAVGILVIYYAPWWYLCFFPFGLCGLIALLIRRYKLQQKRTQEKPENIIKNNQILINSTELYHEILKHYQISSKQKSPYRYYLYGCLLGIAFLIYGLIIIYT